MADAYLRQSPLAHLHLDARAVADAGLADGGVELAEVRHRDIINLRGDAANADFRAGVAGVLGCEPPAKAGTVADGRDGCAVVALGPNEWLVLMDPDTGGAAAARLREALAGQHTAVTEVGDGRTTIRISGPNARDVLAKGTSIDLHAATFGPGRAAEAQIARAGGLIRCVAMGTGAEAHFEIIVAASFAEYLWTWFEDAGREYGVRVGV